MKSIKTNQFLKTFVTLFLMVVFLFLVGSMLNGCGVDNSTNNSDSTKSLETQDSTSFDTEDTDKQEEQQEPTPQEPIKMYFVSPIEYISIGLDFSDSGFVFSPYINMWVSHKGMDLITETETQVKSMFQGVVLEIEENSSIGCMVKVDCGENLIITYGSLSSCAVVVGQAVNQNDIIGVVGSTHPEETGSPDHLHLEIVVGGVPVNPLPYINGTIYREIEQG